MDSLAKMLIAAGAVLVVLGVGLFFADRMPWLGRLPGDIVIQRKGFTFYFPIVTCLLVSLLVTVILWMLNGRR